uniref:Uncharacterized protein n=1 Tax=Octopus bimaculoides TaxID=37653 RepID=A0A0L8GHK2_OCTBM
MYRRWIKADYFLAPHRIRREVGRGISQWEGGTFLRSCQDYKGYYCEWHVCVCGGFEGTHRKTQTHTRTHAELGFMDMRQGGKAWKTDFFNF